MDSCAFFDQLDRLLDEQLDDRQYEAVEDHVEGCAVCQRRLEGLMVVRTEALAVVRRSSQQGDGSPDSGVLQSLKDRGPPREAHRPDRAKMSFAEAGDGAALAAKSPLPKERRLPAVAGFQIIREIGHGGMGVVYEAIELALGRRAALKILLTHRASSTSVERFHREARAAGKLHHTNIVPVFGVGEDDGQLYYVMQFIESESLDQVFDRLVRSAGAEAIHSRTIARIGFQVAGALAYAHEQGILHRDIKPANLLLDTQGSVWVTDFGLAKAFDGEAGLTQTGDTVGTVRYMAPERFDGRSDPRSDVYSLGVTLYELLTLRPLFAESSTAKLIDRVKNDEPAAPRRLDRRIAPDLETIVRMAMSKEPEARYASAGAMAEDLRRYLANEPVLARPLGAAARLVRWCRRQPRLAAAFGLTAASLVLATGLSIALAWSQYQAATRLRAAQALTLAEKTRAVESARDAGQAVEDYLLRVSEETLFNQQDSGEFRQLRRGLLEDALKYYRRFIARQGNDPKLVADMAHAYLRIAQIVAETDGAAEALPLFQQELSIRERIVRENSTDQEAQKSLANCLGAVAAMQSLLGQQGESMRSSERALAILIPLARADASDSGIRSLLGRALVGYGHEQDRVNQPAAALGCFRQAVAVHETQVREEPGVAKWQDELAEAYRGLGVNLESTGQVAQSLHFRQKALELRRALLRDHPDMIRHQMLLATTLSHIGLLLDQMGEPAKALHYEQEALAIWDTRLRHRAGDYSVQAERADTVNWIGGLQSKLGRTAEAIQSYEQARVVIQKLVRDAPEVVRYRQALDIGDTGLAGLYRKAGRCTEALALLDEAQKLLESLPQSWPTYHYHMACCLALRIPPASASRTSSEIEDARRYGDQAMHALRRSVAGGFKTREIFRTSPELEPLHDREDFQMLLMDLALPLDPFAE